MKREILEYFNGNYEPFYRRYFDNPHKNVICPFHDDNNPSMSTDLKTGLFNCFACGVKGDPFTFYALKNGLDPKHDFPKILEGIASEFSIPIVIWFMSGPEASWYWYTILPEEDKITWNVNVPSSA